MNKQLFRLFKPFLGKITTWLYSVTQGEVLNVCGELTRIGDITHMAYFHSFFNGYNCRMKRFPK